MWFEHTADEDLHPRFIELVDHYDPGIEYIAMNVNHDGRYPLAQLHRMTGDPPVEWSSDGWPIPAGLQQTHNEQ